MRRMLAAIVLLAVIAPVFPAAGDPPPWAPAHGRRDKEYRRDYEGDGYRGGGHGYVMSRDDVIFQDDDGRYRCRRRDGTTGLVVGAALGGLIGNRLAGSGSRTLGTLLGAGAGALLGREIDRGSLRCE